MKRNQQILIIGGGVIGMTCAWRLSKFGHRVTLIDQQEMGREASWAAAGMIPPGCFVRARAGVDQLRAWGSEHFHGLSEQLHELTGINNGYIRCGAIEHSPHNRMMLNLRREEIQFTRASSKYRTAIIFPDYAQVRTPRHLRALTTACHAQGVALRSNIHCESWQIENKQVIGIETSIGSLVADHYLIATGAWTESLLHGLGINAGVHPVQGEIILYQAPLCPLDRIILCGKRYIVPRGDGSILVGSTESSSSGFKNQVTPEARASLSQFAEELLPELRHSPIEHQWSGLRPGSRDGVPTIDFVPGHRNVIVAAGHFRAGIQQSLGTAEIVAAMLNEMPSPIPREPFAMDRPAPLHEPLFQS